MSSVAVGTVITKNYLAFARVLATSLRRHHPDLPLHVLVVDDPDGCFDPAAEPFAVLRPGDVTDTDLRVLCRRHSERELRVVLKPYLLANLLDRGYDRALGLDADTLLLDRLDPVLDAMHRAPLTLTPHLVRPPVGPDRIERELNILVSGVYNGGVVGVEGSVQGRAFLANWRARLDTHCRLDLEQGIYFDQRWLDFAPSHVAGLEIVRDPTVNIGHWRLPDPAMTMDAGTLRVEGRPARLFHFSGFEPWNPDRVSRWTARVSMADLGPVARVFSDYAERLREAGIERTRRFPYSYEGFDPATGVSA